jgi:DNA-binding NarL/FixJ family response regulator
LRRALDADARFEACAEIDNAAGAVAAAARDHPDVCVLDTKLPGSGISAAWEIRARLPWVKLVMLTTAAADGTVADSDLFAALRAGADGYLLKTGGWGRLPDALASVCAGEVAVDAPFVARLLKHFRSREPRWRRPVDRVPAGRQSAGSASGVGTAEMRLTSREWEVLDLLSNDLSTADISRILVITQSAVRVHIAAIVRKLNVPDRAAAVEILRRSDNGRSDT